MTDRRDLLRLAGFLVALLVVAGAIVLATQGGSGGSEHAADGLPTRLTYLEEGSTRYALRADDAPLT